VPNRPAAKSSSCSMSEPAAETNPAQESSVRAKKTADRHAFAQVEEWLALIREISAKERLQTKAAN
jgi:hypothetical protein